MSQKATVRRMLEEAGPGGVRSDQFLDIGIPRGAARVGEIKTELEAAGIGTVTSTPEKQFCRYRIVEGVGVGAGQPIAHSERANRARQSASVHSDTPERRRPGGITAEAGGAGPGHSSHSVADTPEGQLFQLPSMNPLTSQEAA